MKVDSEDPSKPTSSKKPREREPSLEKLSNLSRVTPAQLPVIVFPPDCRFQPVRSIAVKKTSKNVVAGGGILVLADKTPGEPIEWMAPSTNISRDAPTVVDTNMPEAEPPAPFEYPFDEDK